MGLTYTISEKENIGSVDMSRIVFTGLSTDVIAGATAVEWTAKQFGFEKVVDVIPQNKSTYGISVNLLEDGVGFSTESSAQVDGLDDVTFTIIGK